MEDVWIVVVGQLTASCLFTSSANREPTRKLDAESRAQVEECKSEGPLARPLGLVSSLGILTWHNDSIN